MSDRRFFNETPEFGIKRYFHFDESTGDFAIETQQDVEGLLDFTKAQQNEYTSLDRWREGFGTKVASIPMTIYAEWPASGKVNDQAFLKRWLNDRNNRHLRTRLGAV